jgi:hypothetical protein
LVEFVRKLHNFLVQKDFPANLLQLGHTTFIITTERTGMYVNVAQTIGAGATLTIANGAKFWVRGSLIWQ